MTARPPTRWPQCRSARTTRGLRDSGMRHDLPRHGTPESLDEEREVIRREIGTRLALRRIS